jgi:hypothetical protein
VQLCHVVSLPRDVREEAVVRGQLGRGAVPFAGVAKFHIQQKLTSWGDDPDIARSDVGLFPLPRLHHANDATAICAPARVCQTPVGGQDVHGNVAGFARVGVEEVGILTILVKEHIVQTRILCANHSD